MRDRRLLVVVVLIVLLTLCGLVLLLTLRADSGSLFHGFLARTQRLADTSSLLA